MMTDGNHFTSFLDRLLEMSRWDKAIRDGEQRHTEIIKEKEKIFWFFYRTVEKENIVLDKAEDRKSELISDLINNYGFLFPIDSRSYKAADSTIWIYYKKAVTYKMLWDFCDFIKLAEYVIFYPNSNENDLYVEAADYQFKKYKEDDAKAINIKGGPNFDLRIELEEVEDHYANNTMHVIKLIIDRKKSGKQVIICMDEVSDDNIDRKDQMILANLSEFICDSCYNVFKDITNSIIGENGVKLE